MSDECEFKQLMHSVESIHNNLHLIISSANQYSNQESIYKALEKHEEATRLLSYWLSRYRYSLRERKVHKAIYFLKRAKSLARVSASDTSIVDKEIQAFIRETKKQIITFGGRQSSQQSDSEYLESLRGTTRHQHRILGEDKYYVDQEYRSEDQLWTFTLEYEYKCQDLKKYQVKEFKKEQAKKQRTTGVMLERIEGEKGRDRYDEMQRVFEEYVEEMREVEAKEKPKKQGMDNEIVDNISEFLDGFKSVIQETENEEVSESFCQPIEKDYGSPFRQIQLFRRGADIPNVIKFENSEYAMFQDNSEDSKGNIAETLLQIHDIIKEFQEQKQSKQDSQVQGDSKECDTSFEKLLKEYQTKECKIEDLICLIGSQPQEGADTDNREKNKPPIPLNRSSKTNKSVD